MSHPKPLELKHLHGTFNATRDRDKAETHEIFGDEKVAELRRPRGVKHREVKRRWVSVTQRLLALGLVYPEDVPTLENAFLLLEQAYRAYDQIDEINKNLSSLLEERDVEESLEARMDRIKLQEQLAVAVQAQQNQFLKLSARYDTIMEHFYATPIQKVKGIFALAKDKKKNRGNPILDVLKDDDE